MIEVEGNPVEVEVDRINVKIDAMQLDFVQNDDEPLTVGLDFVENDDFQEGIDHDHQK